MKTPIVVLDYTKNTSLEQRLTVLNATKRLLLDEASPGLVLYGVRAYPIVEPGQASSIAAWDRLEGLLARRSLDGPPEPYRGVKEAIDMIMDLGLDPASSPIILFWSAPRKPRVDVELAYHYTIMTGPKFSLIIMKPSPPRWLWRSIGSIPEERIFHVRHNTRIDKLLLRLTNEAT